MKKLSQKRREQMFNAAGRENQWAQIQIMLMRGNIEGIKQAIYHGYTLTAQILEALYLNGYSTDVIRNVVLNCVYYDQGIYEWLCGYYTKEVTDKMLVNEAVFDAQILAKVDRKLLVKKQKWQILQELKDYELLAESGQFELCDDETLLKYNQFDILVKRESWGALQRSRKGLDILIANKRWKEFLDCIRYNYFYKLDVRYYLDVLFENGQIELLYEESYWDYLIEKGCTDIFIKNKSWVFLARNGIFFPVKWEELLADSEYKSGMIFDLAAKAGRWDVLAEHKAYRVLLKNRQFTWFWMSLW